ncbi:MAG TPA: hypothetical protein VF275_00740 [Gammaproteobacteria bacterium]
MKDSRKGLEGKTKCELVETLLTEVSRWPGHEPLAAERQARAKAVLTLLGEHRLWLAETHWHALCEIWFHRSSRPDMWLRDFWLDTLFQWIRFLYEEEFAADELPELQAVFGDLPQ